MKASVRRTAYNKPAYKETQNKHRHTLRNVLLLGFILIVGSVYWTYTELPLDLIEFGQKYSEAKGFVLGYPFYKDRMRDQEIHLTMQKGTIPLWLQRDKRWGYRYYGNSLMGMNGCGPTCLSMIVCGLTGETKWDPYSVAVFSNANGYYVSGVGTSWSLMTEGARQLGVSGEEGTVSAEYILANLSVSHPMICSMLPGDFTYTGHFIVLTGIDAKGDIIVNDPNSRKNSSRHWPVDVLVSQMAGIWKY